MWSADELRRELDSHPLVGELSEERLERMLDRVGRRLASVTVVVEDLWDTHNVSAVLRSAEGLGIDRVHVVEEGGRLRRHAKILHGAGRWLEIERWPTLDAGLAELAHRGFLTAAADVGEGAVPIHDVPADRPIAVVLGSEKDGLSRAARERTDLRFTLPMSGFTESFNVSVSAALALWEVSGRRRRHLGREGDLDRDAALRRLDYWLRRASPSARRRQHRDAIPPGHRATAESRRRRSRPP